jgi:hypothetical protein
VLAYHIESSKAGRRHHNCQGYLKEIMKRVADVQVDFDLL